MQFTVRSLGGKLIIVATLTLLLCMLLLTVLSWSMLKFYSEYQAKRDAQTHLQLIQQTYQTHIIQITRDLDQITHDPAITSALSHPATPSTTNALNESLSRLSNINRYSTLAIISQDHHPLAQAEQNTILSAAQTSLVDLAFQNHTASALGTIPLAKAGLRPSNQWALSLALPIINNAPEAQQAVLLAAQPINDAFAQTLTQQTGADVHITLCTDNRVLGTSEIALKHVIANHTVAEQQVCNPDATIIIAPPQYYLAMATKAHADQQQVLPGTPSLTLATTEPLYNLNVHSQRLLLIIVGMAIFVFALGIIIFTFITSVLLIRPLRRLQAHAQALIATNTPLRVELPRTNELNMLANSFNLLSESLYSESQALTEQMSNLLIMSDSLMSTLNLEHLLREFVARMGHIMQVKHVSLLLYGRDMPSPWAVAQWTHDFIDSTAPSNPHSQERVIVFADPDSDITMAVTTKLAAIPKTRVNSSSGKQRVALRTTKSTQTPTTPTTSTSYGRPQPRIPRTALRELDMRLARMAIQRQKIVYAEDIAAIYKVRKENWAYMALETGYQAAISVPLLLQDQAIGAFILYTDEPHQISSRDTFLLSTAALQTSMAIENALLFAEAKEKNVALERANQLKSQFLANVTHELRTPLHSIISYGALILEGFVDGDLTTEQEEHIQFIVRRAEDLSHLVDDMLDLSKIEADRIEVKLEPLDLHSSLADVVNQLKPLANNKNLYLHLETAKDLPMALADSQRVRQIAINLVSNALKFTEKGGVTIRSIQVKNGEMLHISVHDTGIGISPAALSYIFEAFRQADGSTTRRFGGTGLGLTIAKKLIELQGGEIAVESIPGEGTIFSFTLPVVIP